MNQVVELQQPERREVAVATPQDLVRMAVEQGADLDRLERLMALQERWEAGQAKKAYDEAFARFKAEAVRIVKNVSVTNGPLSGKSFADLHAWVNAITPALSKHGLSSSWKITRDEKDWIEVTCFLRHSAGHVETTSQGGPPDAGGAKNAIQARASTVSYLERYTLKAITGLAEQGDDTDGNAGDEQVLAWASSIGSCQTEAELDEIAAQLAREIEKEKSPITKAEAASIRRVWSARRRTLAEGKS